MSKKYNIHIDFSTFLHKIFFFFFWKKIFIKYFNISINNLISVDFSCQGTMVINSNLHGCKSNH